MCSDADFKSSWARLPCCLSKDLLKRDFLDIYLTTFSESVISKIKNLRGLSFFPKFNLDFKNAAQNWEKMFCFWGNCIRIDIVKVSLLRTGYLKSASNVLTSSPKTWHANKRDFFRLNWLAVINKYDKSAKIITLTVFGHVYHVPFRFILWNATFYEGHLFYEQVENLI